MRHEEHTPRSLTKNPVTVCIYGIKIYLIPAIIKHSNSMNISIIFCYIAIKINITRTTSKLSNLKITISIKFSIIKISYSQRTSDYKDRHLAVRRAVKHICAAGRNRMRVQINSDICSGLYNEHSLIILISYFFIRTCAVATALPQHRCAKRVLRSCIAAHTDIFIIFLGNNKTIFKIFCC